MIGGKILHMNDCLWFDEVAESDEGFEKRNECGVFIYRLKKIQLTNSKNSCKSKSYTFSHITLKSSTSNIIYTTSHSFLQFFNAL